MVGVLERITELPNELQELIFVEFVKACCTNIQHEMSAHDGDYLHDHIDEINDPKLFLNLIEWRIGLWNPKLWMFAPYVHGRFRKEVQEQLLKNIHSRLVQRISTLRMPGCSHAPLYRKESICTVCANSEVIEQWIDVYKDMCVNLYEVYANRDMVALISKHCRERLRKGTYIYKMIYVPSPLWSYSLAGV